MPALDGVEHKFVDLGDGVTIHVADAGPAEGPPVMLVHGFPENWWEWHELIGPLAADGYRVLCPDLRGAGWSSAPRSRYLKNEMADDLAAVLDRLGVGPVKLVAHDWGGPVAFIMMLRHPAKVTGFFGVNTAAPYVNRDLSSIRNIWRFWYQIPMALPVIGPRVIGDRKARFFRLLASWVGGGEPKHQKTGVYALLGALVVVVVGSLAGEPISSPMEALNPRLFRRAVLRIMPAVQRQFRDGPWSARPAASPSSAALLHKDVAISPRRMERNTSI